MTTLTIGPPTHDAYVNDSSGGTNYNNSEIWARYLSGPSHYIGCMYFDLSTIPSNAILDSVSLYIYILSASAAANSDIVLQRFKSSWAESTITHNNIPNVESGELFNEDMDSWGTGWKSLQLSVAEFEAMQANNYGFRMYPDFTNFGTLKFASSEYATTTQRPYLSVVYHTPFRLETYYMDALDPEAKVYDRNGREVPPNEIRPNNFIRVTGLDLPSSKKYDNLIEDPAVSMIVGAKMRKGGAVQITPDRNVFGDAILKRLARR